MRRAVVATTGISAPVVALALKSQLLHEAGARHTCVNGGGDLQLRGQAAPGTPWRIGIAHPLRPGELAIIVAAHQDRAVATSGTAERGAHILDPHHGTPVTAFASLTVIGRRLTMTDIYAAAAFARGDGARDWLEDPEDHEALAVRPDGQEWRTPGFSRMDHEAGHRPLPARRKRGPPLSSGCAPPFRGRRTTLCPALTTNPEGAPLWDST